MQTYITVRPEFLNHYGKLFGGQLLKWVDEFSWLAATREFPGCAFVTRAMANVEFGRGVANGSILRFAIHLVARGVSSVQYGVRVFAQPWGETDEYPMFETRVTFVRVDAHGRKCPLPADSPQPPRRQGEA
jgi:acyl-CoA hydrolase